MIPMVETTGYEKKIAHDFNRGRNIQALMMPMVETRAMEKNIDHDFNRGRNIQALMMPMVETMGYEKNIDHDFNRGQNIQALMMPMVETMGYGKKHRPRFQSWAKHTGTYDAHGGNQGYEKNIDHDFNRGQNIQALMMPMVETMGYEKKT